MFEPYVAVSVANPETSGVGSNLIEIGYRSVADEIICAFANWSGNKNQNEIVLIGVLDGGVPFTVDLARTIQQIVADENILIHVRVIWVAAKSFQNNERLPDVQIQYMSDQSSLEDKFVVITDDILDSGKTLTKLVEKIKDNCKPGVLLTAVAVSKKYDRDPNLIQQADFTAVELSYPNVENSFLIGYGLDNNGTHRYINTIRTLKGA